MTEIPQNPAFSVTPITERPFDQRGQRASLSDDMGKQGPHGISHGRAVRVDQKGTRGQFFGAVTAKVDFPDRCQRERGNVVIGVLAMIGAGHKDVVHIQQQPAAGALNDRL